MHIQIQVVGTSPALVSQNIHLCGCIYFMCWLAPFKTNSKLLKHCIALQINYGNISSTRSKIKINNKAVISHKISTIDLSWWGSLTV